MSAPYVLAITTSSGVAKVAFVCKPTGQHPQTGDRIELPPCVAAFEIDDYKSQSALLLPHMVAAMAEHQLDKEGCAAIAVDVGPGGFTSLRTACGLAQGLALAWQVPTVPVSSFEVMWASQSHWQMANCLIDARLNEMYSASVDRNSKGVVWHRAPALMAVDALGEVNGPVLCDPAVHALRMKQGLPTDDFTITKPTAQALGYLGWLEWMADRGAEPLACQPMYVRDKVAQTTSERMALKHGAI